MIINGLDGYYTVFDTKNRNTELDTLVKEKKLLLLQTTAMPSYTIRLMAVHLTLGKTSINPLYPSKRI